MNILSRVKQKLHKTDLLKLEPKKEISHLYKDDDVSLKLLAQALNDVIENKYSGEERLWIEKIESLRKELNASLAEISLVDYGAGSPELNLTNAQMYDGRPVTRVIGEICRNNSKPYKWCFLLFKLIREFRPSVCIELGTAVGISAFYQAAALELNQKGKIITLEGAEPLVELVRKNFEQLELKKIDIVAGRFQDTLKKVLLDNEPIDYIFIDGHHDENATLDYFNQILPFLSDDAVIVFDDISWSDGMQRAWNTIQKNQNLKVSVDLKSMGICIFTKSHVERNRNFRISI